MSSTRPIKLDRWGITWEEYKELSYFCLQYGRKKREAAMAADARLRTVDARALDARQRAADARQRAIDARDVAMIETAARRAGDDLAPWLIQAVTSRCGVQAVFARDRPPIGERQFYELRQRFFVELKRLRMEERG